MPVDYFEYPFLPGVKHFHCDRTKCTLSVESCAEQYRKHRHDDSRCCGCPVGAEHAGERARPKQDNLCCRCGRTDQRVIRRQICISCYNREREWLAGRNAKGEIPRFARPIFSVTVHVSGVGTIRIGRVADYAEALLVALRRHPGATAVVLPPN